MRNALQSRRDYMFIALNVLNLFRSVGAIWQTKTLDKYRTYGAKETIIPFFYKHIVPTGLNIGQSQSSCLLTSVNKNSYIFLN